MRCQRFLVLVISGVGVDHSVREGCPASSLSLLAVSHYSERLLDRGFDQRFADIRARANEVPDDVAEQVEADLSGLLDRIPQVATFVSGVVAAAQPDLVSTQGLDRLDSASGQFLDAVDALRSDAGQAGNVDRLIDETLDSAASFTFASPEVAGRAAMTDEAFSNSLAESARGIGEEIRAQEIKLSELGDHVESVGTSFSDEVSRGNEGLSGSIQSVEGQIGVMQERLDGLLPDYEKQFRDELARQSEEFNRVKEDLDSQLKATAEGLQARADAADADLKEKTTEIVEQIRGRQGEVEELYDVIIAEGTAGAFSDEAKAQRKDADQWRLITLALGIATAVVAIISITVSIADVGQASSIGSIIARTAIIVVVGGLAAYAGRQSGNHRARESEAKSLQLDLVAIVPFTRQLDETSQREVLRAYAERAFTGRSGSSRDMGSHRLSMTGGKKDSINLLQMQHILESMKAMQAAYGARQDASP